MNDEKCPNIFCITSQNDSKIKEDFEKDAMKL
jgi:hypothetical protein